MAFELSEAIALLERTPATFRALLGGLPEPWTAANEGPDTFTAFDNVAHVLHGERADWIPRAKVILARGSDRRFEPFDRLGHVRESAGKSLSRLLDELAEVRAANIATLRAWNLGEAELELEGEHPDFGPVTLRQLLATWVVHDLGHLAQTARVMARRYRSDVGPWSVYLPVLDRR